MKKLTIITLALGAILVSACGGPTSFETVDEMREAVENAGFECDTWEVSASPGDLSTSSANCRDDMVLILYKDHDDAVQGHAQRTVLTQSVEGMLDTELEVESNTLIGETGWSINCSKAEDCETLQESFEGEILTGLATIESIDVLQAAMDVCEGLSSDWSGDYIMMDEGGLFIDGEGDESDGASISDLVCILGAVDTPDSVMGRIEHTTSMMGVVDGSWDDYEAQWSYHPDNGMDISIAVVS